MLPFTGWNFSAVKKSCNVDSLPDILSIHLSQIIPKVVEKLRTNLVKFQFILADTRNIETFLSASLKYDRITTLKPVGLLVSRWLTDQIERLLKRCQSSRSSSAERDG